MQTGFAVFCAGCGKIRCSRGSDKVPREHYFGFHTGISRKADVAFLRKFDTFKSIV